MGQCKFVASWLDDVQLRHWPTSIANDKYDVFICVFLFSFCISVMLNFLNSIRSGLKMS